MDKLRTILIDGKEYQLFPVEFVSHMMKSLSSMYGDKGLVKLKKLAVKLMRRTVWEDMKITNFEQKDKNEDLLLPLTKNEFTWFKNELENPI